MVGPGRVRTSPFVSRAGDGLEVTDAVTGRSHALRPEEAALLDACAEERALEALSPDERALAAGLLDRLLLLDAATWGAIGATTLHTLDLEAAGSCNAACIFCPRDELRHGRGVGVMRPATFARVVEVFAPLLRFVGFAGIGEPTLNKDLPQFVRTLAGRGIETALVTNGSLMTDVLVDALLAAGLGSIQVSFNGNDPASYEDHMVGLSFEATRARVEAMVDRVRGRIPISISAVSTTRNQGALDGFVAYWRGRGVDAGIVRCHSRGGTIALSPRPRPPAAAVAAPRCGLFNTRAFVSWDGRVLACCHDLDGGTELGRVDRDDAAALIARKLEVMRGRAWYPVCRGCDEPARELHVTAAQVRALASA